MTVSGGREKLLGERVSELDELKNVVKNLESERSSLISKVCSHTVLSLSLPTFVIVCLAPCRPREL